MKKIIYPVISILILLFLLWSNSFASAKEKRCIFLDGTRSISSQIKNKPNSTIIVRSEINLKGEVVKIPDNCTIKFEKGCLYNGTLIGNSTLIEGITGSFDNVRFEGIYRNDTIHSNIIKSNPSLKSLVTLVKDNGNVILDTDIKHDGSQVVILKSVTINGKCHKITIPTIEQYCTGWLFVVKDATSFQIKDLVVDGSVPAGSRRAGRLKGIDNQRMMIKVENCDTVRIDQCTFQNSYYNMIHNPVYPYDDKDMIVDAKQSLYNFAHWHFMAFIHCPYVELSNSVFVNMNSEEGICYLPEINYKDFNEHSTADNLFVVNSNRFVSSGEFNKDKNSFICSDGALSSWINVFYGRTIVKNNRFGASGGSQINAFCYNSEIVDNIFEDTRAGNIDLSESGLAGFIPQNVVISGNTAFSSQAFVTMSAANGVTIVNNTYNCSSTPSGYGTELSLVFLYINRNAKPYGAPYSKKHPVNDLYILHNKANDILWFVCDWNGGTMKGEKSGLFIENNEVTCRETCKRTHSNQNNERALIDLAAFENVLIRNNTFNGAGRPVGSQLTGPSTNTIPTFIQLSTPSKDAYFENCRIENNSFISDANNSWLIRVKPLFIEDNNAEVFMMDDLFVRNNQCSNTMFINLNTKQSPKNVRNRLILKNNDLKRGDIYSNMTIQDETD